MPFRGRPYVPKGQPSGLQAKSSANAAKTECPNNHPYDDENTYFDPRGHRRCRQCARDSRKRYLEGA